MIRLADVQTDITTDLAAQTSDLEKAVDAGPPFYATLVDATSLTAIRADWTLKQQEKLSFLYRLLEQARQYLTEANYTPARARLDTLSKKLGAQTVRGAQAGAGGTALDVTAGLLDKAGLYNEPPQSGREAQGRANTRAAVDRVSEWFRANWKVIAGVGTALAVAGTGAYVYVGTRRRRKRS